MAKKEKSKLYDVDKEEKKKSKKKSINKKTNNKKKQMNKSDNKFSFDNEIIIGVTKVQDEKETQKKKSPKKQNNKKENKKKIKEKEKKKNNEKKEKKVSKIKTSETGRNMLISSEEELLEMQRIEEQREIRRKKLAKKLKIVKYIIIIALLITVILVIMFSPLFNIKEIIVEGNNQISTEQIISLSQLKKDINIFKINKMKINKQIQENPYIEEVEIIRNLPSTIVLKVHERKASYLIEYANSYICLDKKGYILYISEEKVDLPILQGIEIIGDDFEAGNRLEASDLNKIYIASKIMDTASNNDMNGLISRIDLENVKNIKIVIDGKEKTAYIGDDTNLNIKLLTIKQILDNTEGQAGDIFVNMNLNEEYPIFRERV